MKKKNFTWVKTLLLCAGVILFKGVLAQNSSPGTGWDNLNPSSHLVINEKFTDYIFLHSKPHTNAGNSKTTVDESTLEVSWGHRNEVKQVPFINSSANAIFYFDTCAFAPEWGVAASVDGSGFPMPSDPTTPGVSNGFVEISRLGYGDRPGAFTVDLRKLPYVEGIQYTQSSTGGRRRGFMVLFSIDDSLTWDTLRFQPGDLWSLSYTKDIFTGDKTYNTYNCEPSASGLLWEDPIYSENVMLKFMSSDDQDSTTSISQQAVRLHDLKVYGDLPTAVEEVKHMQLNMNITNGILQLSETAHINVYNMTGKLILSMNNTSQISLQSFPKGIYIVKANGLSGANSVKKLLHQ